jgi:hypothetical protein
LARWMSDDLTSAVNFAHQHFCRSPARDDRKLVFRLKRNRAKTARDEIFEAARARP